MRKTSFLWITDPWDTLDHSRDTTLRLAQEAIALGHESHWCDVRSIRWERNRVLLDARRILSMTEDRSTDAIELGAKRTLEPGRFDSLQYRTDPPIDLAYQHPLQLLALGLSNAPRSELVNPPSALLIANEKLEAGNLARLQPPAIASSQWDRLEEFGRSEGKTVLKPLFEAQSKGVEMLDWTASSGIRRARRLLTAATDGFTRPALLQRYLKGIEKGEVRLWFLDGKLLAWVKKLPLKGDFRVNLDRGSGLAPHALTARERKTALLIGRHLRKMGVRLAAIDLIDGFATDFNFTSPGLIVLMEGILDRNLARPIIQALAKPVRTRFP